MDPAEEAIQEWKTLVSRRLKNIDWFRVVEDVKPFLERAQDIEFLTRDNLLSLLGYHV